MDFFRRKPVTFDLPTIGDRWDHVSLAPGMSESMSVRALPDGFGRGKFPFVALVQPVTVVLADQFDAWTAATHFALEREGAALLALVHRTPRQVTWYAYSATRAQLDAVLKALNVGHPVRWAINDDAAWTEYEHALALAKAPPEPPRPPEPLPVANRELPAALTVAAPAAPETVRCSPLDTPLGFLKGRDRIHVDEIHFDAGSEHLVFAGDLVGHGEWIAYELHFAAVAAVASENADHSAWASMSDLHDVAGSPWAAAYAADGSPRRHVIVQAHDDLFHIACADAALHLGARRPLEPEPDEPR